jgi:hypothetical protein
MNMNDLFNVVMELDLDPIKVKLMHVESGESWSQAKANAVEKEYRRFLWLMKMYPNESIAPLVDVDTFWHYHILDTMKYARDCEQVFGYFLHHYPYVGMRGGQDEQFRLDSGERMRTLYEASFGDSFADRAAQLAQAIVVRTVPDPAKPGTRSIDLSGMAAKASFRPQGAAATAFCAGPVPTVAFCAGPVPTVAFCAGPVPTIDASSRPQPAAATAFCAGPVPTVAFCAGPVPTIDASSRPQAAAATAFCAGPVPTVAFCAGPVPTVAFCAGPVPTDTKVASRAGESLPRPALH